MRIIICVMFTAMAGACHLIFPHSSADSALGPDLGLAADAKRVVDASLVADANLGVDADVLRVVDASREPSVDQPLACPAKTACLPGLPAGAAGFAWLRSTPWPATSATPPGSPPSCTTGTNAERRHALPSSAACTSCGPCVLSSGCAIPKLHRFKQSGCGGTPEDLSLVQAGVCTSYPTGTGFNTWLKVEPGTFSGACIGSGGEKDPIAPFAEVVDVCAAVPSVGCGAGKVCVPTAPGGFSPGICYRMTPGNPCPVGTTPRETLGAFSDARTCSPCCTTNVSCGGSYTIFVCTASCAKNTTCNMPPLVVPAGSCTESSAYFTANDDSSLQAESSSSGKCTLAGNPGQPGGAILSPNTITFCCAP